MFLKEKLKRIKYKDSEFSQLLYKQLYDNTLSYRIKRKISLKFNEKNKDVFLAKQSRKCLITDRGRGIISRNFKMARYSFRMFALKGKIAGVFKAYR